MHLDTKLGETPNIYSMPPIFGQAILNMYYQWEILKSHFDVTFSSPCESGSQVLSITLHKEPQPAEPAELAGATATQTKKAVLSQGHRTVACFDLLFRQPSAGPSQLVGGGGTFPQPPPIFVNIGIGLYRNENGNRKRQSIYNIVPPDPQTFVPTAGSAQPF